jgi:hypothetical protein
MELSLKTMFRAIQALLLEQHELRKTIVTSHGYDTQEDMLNLEHVEDALEELSAAYTQFISEHHVTNYPSVETLTKTISSNK